MPGHVVRGRRPLRRGPQFHHRRVDQRSARRVRRGCQRGRLGLPALFPVDVVGCVPAAPDPPRVVRARDLESYTGGPDAGAELVSFTDMAECAYNSTFPTSMPNLRQDVANFLLIRGDYAWLGAAWGGCNIRYFRV